MPATCFSRGGVYLLHTVFPFRAVRSEPPGGALVLERLATARVDVGGFTRWLKRSAKIGSQECE